MARPSMASNSSGFPFLEHRHAVDPILITYAVVSHLATGNSLLTASMGIFQYIEWSLGTLLSYARGHDAALLTRSPAFAGIPESIEVSSDIGPSDTHFSIEHTGHGSEGKRNLFPGIEWSAPVALKNEIKEYLVMIEDPDAPIPPRIMQAVHGILYQIPASRTSITQDDLRVASNNNSSNEVRGGFKYGKLIHPVPYAGPRPPCGHGPHRYFYQVVALKQPLDLTKLSDKATKAEIVKDIDGKIAAWGTWVGVYETKLR